MWEYNPSTGKYEWKPKTQNDNVGEFNPKILQRILAPGPTEEEVAGAIFERGTFGPVEESFVTAKPVEGTLLPTVSEQERVKKISQAAEVVGQNLAPFEDPDLVLYRSQSYPEAIGNFLGRQAGIVTGILGQSAAMVDLEDYKNSDNEIGNSITRWANEVNQSLDQEYFPIYQDPRAQSLGQQLTSAAWWLDNGSQLTRSVGSFVGAGLVAGAVTGGIGAVARGVSGAIKLGKLGRSLTKGAQLLETIGLTGDKISKAYTAGTKGLDALGRSTMLTQAEGITEAIDVYDNIYNTSVQKGMSEEEAKMKAAEGASATVAANRVNILLNMTSAAQFMRPMQSSRQILKEVTKLNTVKSFLGEGVQEAAEEQVNLLASEYGKSLGLGTNFDPAKIITSDEGIKSSLLGFIGGAGQTSITAATNEAKFNPMTRMKADDGSYISKNEYLRREYAKQQEEIEKIREMGNTQAIRDVTDAFDDLENTAKTQFEYIQAIENNDEAKLKEIDDRLLAGQAIRSFQTGTAEILEETYKGYATLTPEQAEARGLDTRAMVNGKANPDFYVTKANDAIAKIKRLENRFNTTRTYLDGLDLNVEGATNTDKNTFKNFLLSRVLFETAFQNHAENSIRDLNSEITSLSNGFSEDSLETLDETIRVAEENKSLVSKTNRPEGAKERVIRQYEKEIADLKAQRAILKAKEPTNDSKELIKKNEEDVARLAKELEDSIAETNRLTDSKIQLTDFKKYLDGTKNQQAQANAQNIKQQAQATNTAKTQSAQQQQTVVNNAPTSPLVNSPYNLPFADGSAGLNIGDMIYDSNGLPFVFKGYDPNTGLYTIVKSGGGEVKYTEAGMQGFTKNPPAATQTQTKVNNTASQTEVDPEYYTKQKENEVKAESEKLDEEVLRNDPNVETNVNPDNSLEYLYIRSKVGNNKLAYLSRGYVQTLSGKAIERSDINNVLNDFLFKPLLNPAKYNAGTPIVLLVEDNNDTEMYNPLSDTKEKTTWGAVKATYNLKPGTKEYNDLVPVAIYDNKNNKIGYLHSTDWIKEENIDNTTEAIEEDKNTLSKIRESVVAKPEGVKTKIESKSIGVLFKTSDGKSIPTATAMPDPKLTIAYGKGNGVFETSRGEQFKGTIVNTSIPGIVYAVMPMGGSNIAIPLDRTKLGSDQINIVLKAIRAWVEDDKSTILDINNATDGKIDVAEFSSLKDLLNYFIYSYNTNGQNFKDVLTNLTVNNSEKRLIHVSGNSIEFGRPGLANTWKSINKNAFKLYPADKQNEVYAELAEYLQEQYFNINAGLLGADISIPTVNQKGEVETQFKGKYNDFVKTITTTNILTAEVEPGVYTPFIQPNVTISTEFIEEKKAEPVLTTADVEIKPITTTPATDVRNEILKKKEERLANIKPVYHHTKVKPEDFNFESFQRGKQQISQFGDGLNASSNTTSFLVNRYGNPIQGEIVDTDFIKIDASKTAKEIYDELKAKGYNFSETHDTSDILSEVPGAAIELFNDFQKSNPEVKGVKVSNHIIAGEKVAPFYVIYDAKAFYGKGTLSKKIEEETNKEIAALEEYEPTGLKLEDFQIGEDEAYEDDGMNLDTDELPSSDEMLPETTAVYKDFMVKGLNLNQQSQLVDAVAGDAYRIALQEQGKKEKTKLSTIKDNNKAIIQEKLNVVERNLLRAQAKKDQASINLFTKKKQILGGIIEDWNKVSALIDGKIAKLNGDTAAMDLESVVIDDQEFVRNTFDDDYALTVDSKNTISAQFRKFLAFTTELDSDYKVVPSFLGEYQGKVIPKYVDFDLVYNTLHQLLQGTEPSYEKMIKILEDHVEQKYKNYWVQDVINNLEDASQQIKFQFVVDMTKHYVNMKKVLWSKVRKFFAGQPAGFDYVVTTIDDNANSIKQTILTSWQNNLKDTELVSFVDDEYVFNKEAAKAIIDEAESWNKTNLPSKETLGTWFEKLGIIVDDNVLQTLVDGKFNYNGTKYSYDSLFTNKEGVVKAIADSLKKSINQDIAISDDNFIRQSVVERLAMYQAKNSANVFSNSHRSGDKTVYSFSMNKFAFDRMRKLLDPSKKLATALKSVAFSKDSTWLSWILEDNKTLMNGFSLNYVSLDPFKEMGKGERQSKDLQKLTEGEHEAYKVGLFTSNAATPGDIKGVKYRLTNFMYPTMADKKNAFIMGAYGRVTEVKADGTISDSTIQAIKDNVVIPEINRMIALGKKTINQKGANDKSIYNFYFLPELNNLIVDGESLLNHIKNGDVYPTKFDSEINRVITDYVNALVEEKLQVWKDNNIGKSNNKERFTYMNSAYMNNIAKGSNPEAKLKYAATDMVVNYMIANGNIYQMFLTDPMNYAKFDGDKNLDMAETMSNIGKRLAFDAAPGNTLANADTEEYIQVFLKDASTPSTEIEDYKKLFKNNPEAVKTYEDIEGTDAQEFTTLREHLHVMNLRGLLPDGFYNNVANIIEREVNKGNFYYYDDIIKGLSEEQKPVFEKLVLQVMKPVMTENIIDNVTGHERRLYIKSSSLPLVPAITKNMEIDKLRIALEKAENKFGRTVRAVFGTGTKLGFVNKPINVYNNDGTVVESDAIFEAIKTTDADFTAMMLTRSGFRIQQDVPYSEDHVEINKGTQESKMMFTDLLNVKGFKLPGETKSYTGEELQKLYYDTYKQLYEINLGRLEEDLVDANGLVDTTKLYKILKDELLVRGASINELLGLELKDGAFKIPLWGNPSSLKIQALLNSIVNNRINKIKLPGTSFILGTEEGFQSKPKKAVIEGEEAEEFIRTSKTDIIFTEKWEGKLRAAHTDDKGVFHPDQVLVPPRFMYNGKLVDIQQFVTIRKEEDGTETWMINADRMPSSLLKMFGFRIPTSGHMSMASIEIVGFLPESAGDLVIAPRDFTKRMGSDFDVDKLYAYMYATKVEKTTQGLVLLKIDDKFFDTIEVPVEEALGIKTTDIIEIDSEGNILNKKSLLSETTLAIKEIKYKEVLIGKYKEYKLTNKLLDIHLAIMGNPDAVVQSKIKTPIGYGGLKELGNEVATKKAESEGRKLTTILSDEYYKTKYLNAASGKAAVGVFSLNVVFNGLVQGKSLKLQSFNADGKDVYSVTFGNWKSNGNLSAEKGFTGEYKSLTHSAFQNAALDNEKEAILEKLNINNNTFDFIRSMTQLGYPEDLTSNIINQDVIYSYIELLNKYSSSLFEFTANSQSKAIQEIKKNLGLENLKDEELENMFKLADFEGMSGEEATKKLKDMIANPAYPDYNKYQLSILYKFISLSKDGKDIQDLQTAINIDASGIGKNLFETSTRLNNVYKLTNSTIANAEKMIGNFTIDKNGEVAAIEPTTINGFAVVYALEPANKLWGRFFNPIVSKSFDKIWSEYLNVTMTERLSSNQKSEQMKDLFEDMVSYIYTRNGIISNDINADRARLFIDTKTNKSLASILKSIADNPYVQKNSFLNKLSSQVEKNGNPSKITINAASGENFDEQSIYLGALEMLVGPNQPSLGEFNGINYTPKTLMEDLFKYAYLGDPTQGAIQFTKYLPLSYLIDNNFGGKLKSVDFSADDTFGTYENSSEPSVYITQWAQHNGSRLPKVSDDDISLGKEKSLDKASIITLKGNAVERFQGYPAFISAYNSNAVGTGNKYYIFKKVVIDSEEGQKAVYQKIDSLGAFGMNEYNANVLNQTSVIERQQVKTKPIVSPATEVKEGPEVITNTAKITDAEKLGIKKTTGKEAIKTILNNIANKSSNPYYRVLAEELAKHTDALPSKINVDINNTMEPFGSYQYDSSTIIINTRKGIPPLVMEKAFLHELLHAFTGDVANRFERLGVKNFVETAEDKNAARQQVQAMLRLSRLKSQFIQDVYKKGQGAAFEDFISRYEARKKGKKDVDFTTAEINTFYGGYSLSEFITMSMTEPEFQEILNSIPDANNLPWYQSIVNVIKKIIDSILNLKSDSVLASSIDTTIAYINSIQTTEDVVEELQSEPSSGIPKGKKVKEGIYVNQAALTKEEQLELFNYLKPYLEEQAAKTNKGASASKMIGLGLRWDYKSNNTGVLAVNIPDVINPLNKNKYGYYTTSINNKPLAPITSRFRQLMEKATGVDMTYYDGAIINLYESTTFISSHNDVDESKSAIKYPVIGINIGGTGNFSIESRDGNPIQLDLKPGSGYIFGLNGINRDVFHRTFPKPQDSFLPKLTTKIDGKTYEPGSYRISITMRRVMPLEKGMPESPFISSEPVVTPTEEKAEIETKTFFEYGTEYKFTLENGKPVSADYRQKGGEFKPMNTKGIQAKYDSLVSKGAEIKEEVIPTEPIVTETIDKKYELFPGVYANQGQREAIDKIEEFLDSTDDQFLLKGRGGTGKTTIIKKALESLPKDRVIGATVSYEAKDVLQENMPGYKTSTIAGLLGLVPDYDNKTGQVFFRERDAEEEAKFRGMGKSDPVERAKYIIIDEVSMVSDFLYNKILEKKLKDAKVIFMGDNVQIPPIDESGESKDSPVWKLAKGKNFAELSERMRQGAESPILPITDLYAENVENIQNNRPSVVNPLTTRENKFADNEGVLYLTNQKEVLDQYISEVKDTDNTKQAIIVGARINVVDNFNDLVRERLFNTDEPYVVGDFIRVNSPYVVDGMVLLPNGFKGKVTRVNPVSVPDVDFTTYELTVKYEKVNEDGSKTGATQTFTTINPKEKNLFKNILNKMAVKAKSFPKGSRDSRAAWSEFYRLKERIVDVGYGYAITSHKVQGSTYNSTYVLEGDIMSFPGGKEQTNRMMYTAVSRPRTKLVIYNPTQTIVEKAELPAGGIKEGVSELFESNPELANIGTPQQYSAYLDTIFPDSKVKDILYHGANEPIEGDKFVVRQGATGNGIWFSGSKKYAQIQMDRAQPSESLIGRKLRGAPTMYQTVLNIKNPKNFYNATGALLVQTPSKFEEQYDRKNNDAALFHHPNSKKPATADSADQVVVFETEQIHILGNKQDIEGFTNFVKGKTGTFAEDNLGMSVGDFMKTLSKEERSIMRDAMGKVFKTKCK